LISRQNYGEVPPRVEYVLTPLGSSLLPIFNALNDWAIAHSNVVLENHVNTERNDEEPVAV